MGRGILAVMLLVSACGERAGTSCTWGVDELLEANDLPREKRENCGSFSYAEQALAGGVACLQRAVDAKTAAELTVNNCVDCSIPSTFVATRDGDVLRIELEADELGDEFRTATVERCTEVINESDGAPACQHPAEVYHCQDEF